MPIIPANRFSPDDPINRLSLDLITKIMAEDDSYVLGGGYGGDNSIPSGFGSIGSYGNGMADTANMAESVYVQDFDAFANSLLGKKAAPTDNRHVDDTEKADVLYGQDATVYPKPNYDRTTSLHHSLDDHYFPLKGKDHDIYNYGEHSKSLNSALIARYDAGANMKRLGAFKEYGVKPEDVGYVDHKALDSIVRQTKSPHDLTLYTGIRRHPQKRANGDGLLHLPAYTSTSLNAAPAISFATKSPRHISEDPQDRRNKHVLKISYPKGSHGVYIGKQTDIPGEREFLMPRGVTLRISDNPRIIHDPFHDRHVHIWDAEPVSGHK